MNIMNSVSTKNRVLLISNSTLYGSGYLDHAESEIRDVLGDVERVLFVPYALYDRNAYSSIARKRFKAMGYQLDSIRRGHEPVEVESGEKLDHFIFASPKFG
jgi:dipeptidase E